MPRAPATYLLRIARVDKRRKDPQHKRVTFRGKRFELNRGWYKVTRAFADAAKKLVHPSTNLPMFEVVSKSAARKISKDEDKKKLGSSTNPRDATDA